MEETYDMQMRDSDMIFKQITWASYDSLEEANRAICIVYVPDMTISRAGISHALKRIENWYREEKERK